MSILIKDMEMPEHGCNHCRFRAGNYCALIPGPSDCTKYAGLKQKRPDCPLVPIPPHGDLVDRSKIEYPYQMHGGVLMTSNKIIGRLPTIIPAEEGEND